jgi:Tol biopolymer transport system component
VRRDRNRLEDVFLYDWSSRNVRRVSRGPAGAADAHISGNGRLVLYYTGGAQVRGDTNRLAEPYLFRRGDGRYLRVARRAGGGQISSGGCDQVGMDISYTGRFVLATCRDGRMANPQIADKTSHLWRIDRRTGRNVLVNRTTSDYSAPWGAAVSDDGRRVVFAMRGGAVGGTPFDDRDNVYLWRAGRGVTNLTPGPLAWWWNFTQDISGDGRFALFSSDAHAMSSRDLNDPQQVDLFLERLP